MLHTEKGCAPVPLPRPTAEITLLLGDDFAVKRVEKNALLLEFGAFHREGEMYSEPLPALAVQQILVEQDYHGKLWQKYVFRAECPFDELLLALEDADEHEIWFNGVRVESRAEGYYLAKSFQTVRLPRSVVGENVIELCRDYVPLSAMKSSIGSLFQTRTGTEIESAYLVGDFAVTGVQEPERNGCLRLSRRFVLTEERGKTDGELVLDGYPFFAGTVLLSKRFETDLTGDVRLTLDVMDGAVGRVFVNGRDCGILSSAPYSVDVSSALTVGENTVEIALTNTLRNLLGPYHRPFGEYGTVWGGYGYPDAAWVGVGEPADAEWYNHRVPDTPFWTDSYLQTRFGIRGAKLVKRL